LIKAIGESTGRTLAIVKADLKKEGDLGLVAMVRAQSMSTAMAYLALRTQKIAKRPCLSQKPSPSLLSSLISRKLLYPPATLYIFCIPDFRTMADALY